MARLACAEGFGNERGVVYVEFLLAFIPLFTLVLGVCQLAFIASAKAVVEHAAWAAARSAVVVLEDDPKRFGGIARGDHLSHTTEKIPGIGEVMAILNIDTGDAEQLAEVAVNDATNYAGSLLGNVNEAVAQAALWLGFYKQLPSRMTPIRAAAYLPLLPLANTDISNRNHSVDAAIHDDFFSEMSAALTYNRAAAAITLHLDPDSEEVAGAAFAPDSPVTARVVYLYSCDVPVVRTIMCRSYSWLMENGDPVAVRALKEAENASELGELLPGFGRYTLLVGKASLVNQGALYESRDESEEEEQ